MGTNPKILVVIALCIVGLQPSGLSAQDDRVSRETLRVGVTDIEPFAMKNADGQWEGIGIDLWREIAKEMGVDFKLQEYGDIAEMTDAFTKGELDLTPTVGVTLERVSFADFSVSYYRWGTAIAVAKQRATDGWLRVFERFFSLQFLAAVGFLILVWMMAGAAMWLFERRQNREMFGGGPVEGVAQGIWWAAVTMTTVGYGDKAPKTLGGRIIAIIWMFAAIVLISSFTATIASTLTVGGMGSEVRGLRDLQTVRVGTMAGSDAQSYLVKRGVEAVVPFDSEQDGLQSLVEAKIDAFVYDASTLAYLEKTEFRGRIEVLPKTFDHRFVSFALPRGSAMREPLNRAILKIMASDEWTKILARY